MAWSLLRCTTVPKTSTKCRHQSTLAGWFATMLVIFQTHFVSAAFTDSPWKRGSFRLPVFLPQQLNMKPVCMWSQLCFLSTGAGSSPGGVQESLRWVFTSFLFSWMQDNTVKVVHLRGSSAYSKKWVTAGSFPPPTVSCNHCSIGASLMPSW